MGIYAVLSDVHGNDYALEAVFRELEAVKISGAVLLGDMIDYGMQPNEAVRRIRDSLGTRIVCSIWGNHENAVLSEDFSRLSSGRGTRAAAWTASVLDEDVRDYINVKMISKGCAEFELEGLKCLAVHGSLEDCYWIPVLPGSVHGDYSSYDVVFSGHSHYSHAFMEFYPSDDKQARGKHAVLFINPGSVGQPRNRNPNAQYALFHTETQSVELHAVPYDIGKAVALYDGSVDDFYCSRLMKGI